MKRLLPFALIAALMAAPQGVLAQTKTPPAPAPAAQPTKTPEKPSTVKPAEKPKDEKPKTEKPADAKPAAMDDKAGPNHKMLEWFEGEWTAEVKDLTPGQEATDAGTMTCKMVYGGRFLSMDFDGRSHGKFFRGGGTWGYNNAEKRFESTWADSQSTAIMFMTGSSSGDGKTFTMSGECADPATGKKAMWKEVTNITGKDTWHTDFFAVNGGKEMKIMEISYTKGKAEKGDKGEKDAKPKGK